MSREVLLLIDVLAKEKNLEKEIVFECLEKALAIASKKSFEGEFPEIEVSIDRGSGKYKTIRKYIVTSDVDFYDDDKELSLSDIKDNPHKYGNANIGDTIEEEIENIDLGRVSAQTARNIIAQKIKDAEREHVVAEYMSRNHGIVSGRLKKFERANAILDCGKIEAIIMKQDIIPKEVLRYGDTVKGYLDRNKYTTKNGRLVISRTDNQFLRKIIELNVPEIQSGRVEIMAIAREPGIKAKVAVYTNDARIDPKGACIGFRNQRIDSIIQELAGEKVEVIEYDQNLAQYTINAFAPAEINSIIVDEEKKVIDVIVDDDKLGSAIGPDGINVRLVSKLIAYSINILGTTAAVDKDSHQKDDLINIFNLGLEVTDDISELLVKHGFSNLEEVAYVDVNELLAIEEFDQELAQELQLRAKNKLLAKNIRYKDKMDNLSQQLATIAKFSPEVLLTLVEAEILTIADFADLATDELVELISVDIETANALILKARELSGYFN